MLGTDWQEVFRTDEFRASGLESLLVAVRRKPKSGAHLGVWEGMPQVFSATKRKRQTRMQEERASEDLGKGPRKGC